MPRTIPTLGQLVEEYIAQHVAEPNTLKTLEARLKYATTTFGDVRLDRLHVPELAAWRKRLPEGSAWHITKALRQVLAYAVAAGYVDENIAKKIRNPEPKRREVQAFADWTEIEAVAREVGSQVPIIAAGTGATAAGMAGARAARPRPPERVPARPPRLHRREGEADREDARLAAADHPADHARRAGARRHPAET
jgi:hypothetical protein